jgi:putative Mg2+ transporter-C (MgtC) family protein
MTTAAIWLRLLIAVVLGGAIGLEREVAGQPAGLRTYALVSLGSALFTIIGLGYFAPPLSQVVPPGDATRIVGALVTGIGFLGAGAIVRPGGGAVQGLTTAAALWATAAVGLAVGSGFELLAGGAVALILLILWGFERLKVVLHLGAPEDQE